MINRVSYIASTGSLLCVLLFSHSHLRADEVIFWNNSLMQAIRDSSMPPPRASRAMAMVHTATFDAVNSIHSTYQPYHQSYSFAPGASAEAAVAQSARDVLVSLFPAQQATFDSQLSTRLSAIAAGPDRDAGIALGASAAEGILNLRANDNSDLVVPYTPGTDPGNWRPTPPGHAPALLPNWPLVTPWAMTSGSQFRHPIGPPALNSPEYLADLNEVRLVGSVDAEAMGHRTADQTQIAFFWADGAGTATPPGHWNLIAQDAVQNHGLSLIDSARTFALLNIGVADSAIACWDNKFTYDFWRPVTAIREDGLDPDPSWTSLVVTPPFPSYTSGHSTFSGAASEILTYLFGDDYHFDASQEGDPSIVRSFTSFYHAANEAAESRLFGGIHFRFDNYDGLVGGLALGDYVSRNFLSPVPEPTSFVLIFTICLGFALRRFRIVSA